MSPIERNPGGTARGLCPTTARGIVEVEPNRRGITRRTAERGSARRRRRCVQCGPERAPMPPRSSTQCAAARCPARAPVSAPKIGKPGNWNCRLSDRTARPGKSALPRVRQYRASEVQSTLLKCNRMFFPHRRRGYETARRWLSSARSRPKPRRIVCGLLPTFSELPSIKSISILANRGV